MKGKFQRDDKRMNVECVQKANAGHSTIVWSTKLGFWCQSFMSLIMWTVCFYLLWVYFWNNNIQTKVYWRATCYVEKGQQISEMDQDGQSRMSDDESTIHTDYTTECINVMIHHPWTEWGEKKRNFFEIDENEWNMAISTFCNSKWKQTAIEVIQSMKTKKSDTFDLSSLLALQMIHSIRSIE